MSAPKITGEQWDTIQGAIGRALMAAWLPGIPSALVAQVVRNERRSAQIIAHLGEEGQRIVERSHHWAKQIGERHPGYSYSDALDVIFDLEIDSINYGKDDENVQHRRMWLEVIKIEVGITEGA